MSGDEELTGQAVLDYKSSVPKTLIPDGWEEFVHGIRAFEVGEYAAAVAQFENSCRQKDTIAAEAMLALSRSMQGDLTYFAEKVRQLDKRSPEYPEDYLFLARVVHWTGNFGDAKEYLNRHASSFSDASSMSVLERIIRLSIDASLAQQSRDSADASRIALEFEKLRKLVPNSTSVRSTTIANHVWAYRLLKRAQKMPEAEVHLALAKRLETELVASDREYRSLTELADLYDEIGQTTEARILWDKAIQRGMLRDKATLEYTFFLLRQHEYGEAIQTCVANDNSIELPRVMALLGHSGGRAEAIEFLEEIRREVPQIPIFRVMHVAAWYLCGQQEKARLIANSFSQQEVAQFEKHSSLNMILKYLAQVDDDPELLLGKLPNESMATAKIFVAMRMCRDNRRAATSYVQSAYQDSGDYFEHSLSKTFLELLQDENWPATNHE